MVKKILTASTALTEQHSHEYLVSVRNKSEWSGSLADYASNLSRVHSFDEQLRIAGAQLAFLLGYSKEISLGEQDVLSQMNLVWEQPKRIKLRPLGIYQQLARECRPEIKISQKIIEFHQQEAHIAARKRLPTASLGAIASQTSSNYDGWFLTGINNAVNVVLSWPIFDGLVSDYEREKAQAMKMDAILQKQEVDNLVRSQVEAAYFTLKQSLYDLTAEHFRYMRARNEFEIREIQFNQGLITRANHLQAMASWQDVQYGWINKKTDVAINLQKLFYRCGYPEKNKL